MSAWEWFGTILRQLVNAGVEVVQRKLSQCESTSGRFHE